MTEPRPVAWRRALALLCLAVAGFAAGCGSKHNGPGPGTVPPPQPTTGHTGTPSTPSNTNRTTTEAGG
jgi:hypothetical protein